MRIRWRNFELPTKVQPDRESLTTQFGRFVVEPFERGFGHTIGNGLRRVLLSSIEGAAVTAVRIQGAKHEFDSLEGIYEDVADIILKVKRLRIRYDGTGKSVCRVSKSTAGPVTGAVPAVNTRTKSCGAGYGNGRSNTQSTTENTAALRPMPIASDKTAAAVVAGWRRSIRTAYSASRHAASSHRQVRASRCSSFVCSMPPSARRAERRAWSGD